MSIQLKLYGKTLACETRILREEEKRLAKRTRKAMLKEREEAARKLNLRREEIYKERKTVVREEARAVNLAVGFIRGHDYLTVENTTKSTHEEMMDLSQMVFEFIWSYTDSEASLSDIQEWMLLEEEVEEDNSDYFTNTFNLDWLFGTKEAV